MFPIAVEDVLYILGNTRRLLFVELSYSIGVTVLSSSEDTPIYGCMLLSVLIPSLNPDDNINPLLFYTFFRNRSIGVLPVSYCILNRLFVSLFEVTFESVFSIA